MKISKKLLASVLSLIMMLSCFAVPSFAAEGNCAYSEDGVSYHQAYSLEEAFEALPSGGYVKLLKDVMIKEKIVLNNRSITFAGNTHRIIRDPSFKGSFFEFDYSGGEAPVSVFKDVTFEGNKNNVTALSSLVKVFGGVVNFTNVKMINNYNNENWNSADNYAPYGGALAVGKNAGTDTAVVNMKNCTVSDCYTTFGGGVALWYKGVLNAEGTTFKNNESLKDGGAVAMIDDKSLFNATDCIFTGNHCGDWGGAITCTLGSVYLTDVKMIDNYTVINGEGGAICVPVDDPLMPGYLELNGTCYITGNYSLAGGIKKENNITVYDGISMVIGNNFSNNSVVGITAQKDTMNPADYILGAVETVSNSLIEDVNHKTYLYNGEKITLVHGCEVFLNGCGYSLDKNVIYAVNTYGDLPDLARPGYSFAGWYTKSTGGDKVEDFDPFTEGQSAVTLYARWAPALITYSVKGVNYGASTLADAVELCEDGGTVQLIKDAEIDGTVMINKNITVKSSTSEMRKITRKDETFNNTMFKISSDVNINVVFENIGIDASPVPGEEAGEPVAYEGSNVVFDIGSKSDVTFKNAVIENNFGGTLPGSALYLRAGAKASLKENSAVKNCSAEKVGAAVYMLDGSVFTAVDSVISDCYIRNNGNAGGIYALNSDVVLKNSSLTGNAANEKGGAVYLNGGSLTVSDNAVITENLLADKDGKGAGVYIENGKINIKGDAYIFGNLADKNEDEESEPFESNVYIEGSSEVITFVKLGYDSLIGFSGDSEFDNNENADFIKYSGTTSAGTEGRFANDKGGYFMPDEDGTSKFCFVYKVTFDANKSTCAESYRMVAKDTPLGALPVPEEREDFTFEGWATASKYGEGTKYTSESTVDSDITLYAQWHNNYALDGNPLGVFGRFFQRIAEIFRAAFLFLGNLFGGTGISEFKSAK